MGESLDRLVGGAILSKTNGIMGCNPNDLVTTESGEADGTSSVRDKVLSQMVRDQRSPHVAVYSPKR